MATLDTRTEFNQLCHWLCWPVRWDWVHALRGDLTPCTGDYRDQMKRAFERYDDLLAELLADFNEHPESYFEFLVQLERGLWFLSRHGGHRHDAVFWREKAERFVALWDEIDPPIDLDKEEEEEEESIGTNQLVTVARNMFNDIDAKEQEPAAGAAKPSEEHLG